MNKAFIIIPLKAYSLICVLIAFLGFSTHLKAQDTSKSILDLNNTKIIKKVNAILDSNQKKLNKFIFNKADSIKSRIIKTVDNALPKEMEKPLPYERLLKTKYTLGRRAYQNTVAQYNYFFNGQEELNEIISKARNQYQDDYTSLIGFYDYDLNDLAKYSIDSIIYRCNANIVLHDLRNNWVDDAYLLMAKAYLYHKNFDTAGSILQFINYSFDEKDNGADLPIGSNLRNTKGKFSIATAETNRIWENENVRNESMIWKARNYFETDQINEGLSLLELLKSDAYFPKRLNPFLHEQLSYGYYLSESYENAANNLIKALPNAIDGHAKARWYFLIAQLFDKANQKAAAYPWFQKASQLAINPIIGVYAKINMIEYEIEKGNEDWKALTFKLEKLTSKNKYIPYADIIYFEMAKLAIQNKDSKQASDWLIESIRKNSNNYEQRQRAFEQLGNIHYELGNYSISKMAYDSLTSVLKSNPNYESIIARKKWMGSISTNQLSMNTEDSLLYLFKQPEEYKKALFNKWSIGIDLQKKKEAQLFTQNNKELLKEIIPSSFIETNLFNKPVNEFYFQNKIALNNGKQLFIQKWGERPNLDNWRRKTSGNIAYAKVSIAKSTIETNNFNDTLSSKMNRENGPQLIQNKTDLDLSLKKWNEAAIQNASLFLLQLNDFEKALPIYREIIDRDINETITERALLDLASEYIHDNKKELSDAIIINVVKKYPKGIYVSKLNDAKNKTTISSLTVNNYKNAYFLSKIGKWDSLLKLDTEISQTIRKTKWNTPYQFIRVKLFAQQKNDSMAIVILDSIILQNQNESIRERAKNIITELKNRKITEAYLSQLVNLIPQSNLTSPIEVDEPIVTNIQIQKDTKKIQKNNIVNPIQPFTNDSSEEHFMAMIIKGTKEVFIKEAQNALEYLNNEEFNKLGLSTSFVQFNDETHIVWVGPFDNQKESIAYTQKIKPRLNSELISFIPVKQYEIFIFGKSNILLINDFEDILKYKEFMFKNIYKK